jgi:eukaryotic-like serine/threonine-protein kinase
MLEGDPQGPSASMLPAADPLIGRVLNGRFRIVEPLGSGGMGKVYKAVQSPLDRVVALKILNPNFPAEKDPAFKRRFFLEASLTSKLRHPNTVTVIDYGQTDDGIFFIAMEFLDGQTLAEVLAQEKTLTWTRVLDIGQQICRSLREAHKLGVIHRDLKPANVMLLNEADQDMVKVLDFGLVKSFLADLSPGDPEVTQNGVFLGSPQYMAPEQARNVADPRSDVYSLGILMYQMLTGRPPFLGKDYLEVIFLHMKEPPKRLRDARPGLDVPAEVEAVLLKCLEKDPLARYQSMDELLEAIRYAAQISGASGIFPERRSGVHATPPPLPAVTTGAHALSLTPPPEANTMSFDIAEESPAAVRARAIQRLALIGGILFALGAGFFVTWLFLPKVRAPVEAPAPVVAAPAPVVRTAPPPEAPLPVERKMVRFHVSTDPLGAHVFVGRHDLGATPAVFELPAGPDGMASAEMVLVLDGYPNQAITSGGSGDVAVNAKLQKKVVTRVATPVPLSKEEREKEREATPVPIPVSSPSLAQSTAKGQPAGAVAAVAPPVASAAQAAPVPNGDLVPFGEGMTRPVLIERAKPVSYTPQALEARVEGTMVVRCIITVEGHVEKCLVLKTLPFLEQAVLESLYSSRYSPVTYQGKPVAVGYTFSVKLVPPS